MHWILSNNDVQLTENGVHFHGRIISVSFALGVHLPRSVEEFIQHQCQNYCVTPFEFPLLPACVRVALQAALSAMLHDWSATTTRQANECTHLAHFLHISIYYVTFAPALRPINISVYLCVCWHVLYPILLWPFCFYWPQFRLLRFFPHHFRSLKVQTDKDGLPDSSSIVLPLLFFALSMRLSCCHGSWPKIECRWCRCRRRTIQYSCNDVERKCLWEHNK